MDVRELQSATAKLGDLVGLHQEPLAFVYSDTEPSGFRPEEGKWACILAVMGRARRGETVYFDAEHVGCGGGGYFLGLCERTPKVEYFVSTGIPGEMEGEHYKQSPEIMLKTIELYPMPPAPAKYAIIKPLSALTEEETPEVIICLATPDQLCGLVMLAGFARAEDAVLCPFSSGCGSIISRPLLEAQRAEPRAVVGIFDPSSRLFLREDEMTFAAPRALWEEMLGNADESFLKTETWAKVRRRIGGN
ncbi:MAG: hypothetical protein FJX75_28795 [Armatimonadetes bacterium]|nr:hypothetical protein [Armatimonadota bacterium]